MILKSQSATPHPYNRAWTERTESEYRTLPSDWFRSDRMLYVFACVSPTPLPQTDICTDLQARSHGTDNPSQDTLVLIIFIQTLSGWILWLTGTLTCMKETCRQFLTADLLSRSWPTTVLGRYVWYSIQAGDQWQVIQVNNRIRLIQHAWYWRLVAMDLYAKSHEPMINNKLSFSFSILFFHYF